MSQLILFNKPWGVLSQFTDSEQRPVLADYIKQAGFYPAGRLDRDSEGLLLLTDDGKLQHQLANPRQKTWKTYLAQVDGMANLAQIEKLKAGILLRDGPTLPARAKLISEPDWLWPRTPPIRVRLNLPTSWISLSIREGRNRQVRRMTAAVGLPTLRLIRTHIGEWQLNALQPGETQHKQVQPTSVVY